MSETHDTCTITITVSIWTQLPSLPKLKVSNSFFHCPTGDKASRISMDIDKNRQIQHTKSIKIEALQAINSLSSSFFSMLAVCCSANVSPSARKAVQDIEKRGERSNICGINFQKILLSLKQCIGATEPTYYMWDKNFSHYWSLWLWRTVFHHGSNGLVVGFKWLISHALLKSSDIITYEFSSFRCSSSSQ